LGLGRLAHLLLARNDTVADVRALLGAF